MATKATHAASPAVSKGYKPNMKDPRVRARVKQALGWTLACLDDEPREISKIWIDASFGQQQNDLSRWLRCKLLRCVNGSYFWGEDSRCKQYVLNRPGVKEVQTLLNNPGETEFDLIYSAAQRAHGDELQGFSFDYEEKTCARLWHPLQNIRKSHKVPFWRKVGLLWNYDVVACAPTLILRYAMKTARDLGITAMDEVLQGIDDYLKNPRGFREHVCTVAGWDCCNEDEYKLAKNLINALFCGARLSVNERTSLFRLIGNNHAAMVRLQNDERLKRMTRDISICWKTIDKSMLTLRTESGRKLALSSRRKWKLYFQLERQVLDVAWHYLSARGIKCFLEHDGWRTDKQVDIAALEAEIESITGFDIKISGESLQDDLTKDFVTNPRGESAVDDGLNFRGREGKQASIRSPIVLKVTGEKDGQDGEQNAFDSTWELTCSKVLHELQAEKTPASSSYSLYHATGRPSTRATHTGQ